MQEKFKILKGVEHPCSAFRGAAHGQRGLPGQGQQEGGYRA